MKFPPMYGRLCAPRSRGPVVLALFVLASVAAAAGSPPTSPAAAPPASILPAPADAGWLPVENGRLYYESFGSGYPLVFVHDGLAHREVWDAQVAAFASGYRVVRYDRRGYGKSDAPTQPYSDLADLLAVFQGLRIGRAVIVASSAGGGLSLHFALDHPELVEALVLCGPVVSGLGYTLPFLRRAYANYEAEPAAMAARWVMDPWTIAPGNDAARERLRALFAACPQDMDWSRNRFGLEPPETALPRLGEISAPTLLIVGAADHPDVLAHVGAIEAGIRGARRALIEGAAHLCYLERPEEFNHLVREFLSMLSLAPGAPRATAAPPAPWPTFARGFAPVPGSALYYEAMGAGEPVVLLHGGALDHRSWDREFVELAAHYRVIRYDSRGQGLSPSPGGVYRHYEDLGRLLDHLGLPSAHLIGLSLGARIAVDFAIAQPARVRSLTLVSPGVSGYDFAAPEEREANGRFAAAWRRTDWAQAAEEFVRAWCDGPRRAPEQTPPEVRARVKAISLANVGPHRDTAEGRELEPPAVGRLGEIAAPTLALLGELDMPGIHTIVGMVREQVRGARVVTVPGVAHMINLERPAEFMRALREFLPASGSGQ